MNVNKTIVNNASPKMANRFMSDKKELEKYLKVFCQKIAQVIVQSRLGEKIQTFSNPRSLSNDWVSVLFRCSCYWWLEILRNYIVLRMKCIARFTLQRRKVRKYGRKLKKNKNSAPNHQPMPIYCHNKWSLLVLVITIQLETNNKVHQYISGWRWQRQLRGYVKRQTMSVCAYLWYALHVECARVCVWVCYWMWCCHAAFFYVFARGWVCVC